MREKAIIVVLEVNRSVEAPAEAGEKAVSELNQHLADGWRVKQSCAMGGSGHKMVASSLVILERDDQKP